MIRRLIVASAVALPVAIAGSHLNAQQSASQTAPNAPAKQTVQSAAPDLTKMPLVGVNVVQIKPELVAEWQEFQKNEVIPTLQKGGVKQRTGIVTAIGPSFEYAFLTPLASFADRDGDSPIVKALGEDGARAFGQKNRRFIASQRTLVVRVRTDLSYQPDPNAPTPIAVVSNYSLAAGRASEFA